MQSSALFFKQTKHMHSSSFTCEISTAISRCARYRTALFLKQHSSTCSYAPTVSEIGGDCHPLQVCLTYPREEERRVLWIVHSHKYTHTHAHTHTLTIHTCAHTVRLAWGGLNLHTHKHTQSYTYTHLTHTRTRTRTHTHTHIHSHIHTHAVRHACETAMEKMHR
jgi:hypothetical protein